MRYNPDSPKAILSRALVDVNSGRTQQAIEELGQALKPIGPETQVRFTQAIAGLAAAVVDDASAVASKNSTAQEMTLMTGMKPRTSITMDNPPKGGGRSDD